LPFFFFMFVMLMLWKILPPKTFVGSGWLQVPDVGFST
jgi:hypothetical protein